MTSSDNSSSRQQKIERLVRLSQGMKPEEADADLANGYEPKPHEIEAAKAFVEATPLPQYKALNGLIKMVFDHPRQEIALAVVMKAWGVTDENLFYSFIRQLINAVSKDDTPDVGELNSAIATVAGIEPRNHLEAMLAVQMTSVHMAALRHIRLMHTSVTIEQLDIHERAVNKLMRTFTSQMEALRKHRNGGNQKVVVEHVHVHEGGQAIVGHVTHGGRDEKEKGTQSHGKENLPVPTGAAVLSYIEADEIPVPGAGREGQERVPVPRRAGGSAKG
jgi:hypothetical protein